MVICWSTPEMTKWLVFYIKTMHTGRWERNPMVAQWSFLESVLCGMWVYPVQCQGQFFPTSRKRCYDWWCSLNFRNNICHICVTFSSFLKDLKGCQLSVGLKGRFQLVQAAVFPYGLLGPNEISGAQKSNEICGAEMLNKKFTEETSKF